MTAKDIKAQITRDTILDAAVELFIRDGFEKTPMDAIAAAADVAKGTLYYHYDSKEGILDAILARYVETTKSRFDAVQAEGRTGALGKLALFVETLKDVNSATFSRLHRMKYIDIHEKTSRLMVDEFAPYFARILEEGSRSEGWRVEDPLEVAEILLGAGAILFDPDTDRDKLPKRVHAFARFFASAMGVHAATLGQALAPLASSRRDHRSKRAPR